MAIFSSSPSQRKDNPSAAATPAAAPAREQAPPAAAEFTPTQLTPPRATAQPEAKESLIASDLTIEGKIQGSGHVRIAGRFKGDVDVQGNLRIDNGAKLNGGVKAKQVVVAGELEGNIDAATRVELLDTAVMVGDIRTGTLIVNAGSKIRGHVECGWDGKDQGKANGKSSGA